MKSAFITLEGGEGSGKTTQIKLLETAFAAARTPCIRTREPGGSTGAEKIRDLLVNGDSDRWDASTETLLFYAARLDHVNKLIRPALQENKVVICDRFTDSTMVYQGVGKKLPEEFINKLHELTLADFAPDMTIILDIDPTIGLKRASERSGAEDRFEGMAMNFHYQVRQGFLTIAEKSPDRCVVVDASQKPQEIHASIITLVNERLGFTLMPHG